MTSASSHNHSVGGHGHSHGHHHGALRDTASRRLWWTLVLVLGYMVAEVVGGLASNSLALLADAGHMLSDAGALALSLFAIWIARKPPTPARSFGYYRAEILAALVNGAALGAISLWVIVEAYHRLWQSPGVRGPLMMVVAAGGLLVNMAGLWLLNSGRSQSINLHGAWLHMLSDLLGSLAALAGGAAVWAWGWEWADPAASAVISLLIVYSSWGLMRDAISILMEGTPGHVDLDEVRNAMAAVPGVTSVHDVHVWTITSGMEALSGHVTIDDDHAWPELLGNLRATLHTRFGIDHITIQIEPPDFTACETRCPAG